MAVNRRKIKAAGGAAPLPVGRALGAVQRRALLPEGTVCLAPLGSTAVAAGFDDGVRVTSFDGRPLASALGFVATCLASLGSQSLAAGDSVGKVRVWHWRRGTLKLVYDVSVHAAAVRALANSGDVLFTASADGFVRGLEVLENFAPGDFSFSAGTAVGAVATAGKRSIMVGCEDGHVLEVHRKSCEVLQRLEFGAPVTVLDVNEEDGRLLAAGSGCLAVWRLPLASRDPGAAVRARRSGAVVETEAELCGKWTLPGVISAMLLAGGRPDDILVAGTCGILRGGVAQVDEQGVQEDAAAKDISGLPAAAMVRGSLETALVAILENSAAHAAKAEASGRKSPTPVPATLFELELPKPLPESKSQSSLGSPPASQTQAAATTNSSNRDAGALRMAGLSIAGLAKEPQAKVEEGKADEASPGSRVQSPELLAAEVECKSNKIQNRSSLRKSLRTDTHYYDPTEASRARSSMHDSP